MCAATVLFSFDCQAAREKTKTAGDERQTGGRLMPTRSGIRTNIMIEFALVARSGDAMFVVQVLLISYDNECGSYMNLGSIDIFIAWH